ncbi:MAG: DUF3352 domain-containing protein [Capsulimonadaceae bacterium]
MYVTNNAGCVSDRKHLLRRFAVGALALLFALNGASVPSRAQSTSVSASFAQIVPRGTFVFGGVDANWLWDALSGVRAVPRVSAKLDKLQDETGLTFEKDIAPWIGRAGYAVSMTDPANPSIILYAEARDSAGLTAAVNAAQTKLQANGTGKVTLTQRLYGGTTVYDIVKKNGPSKDPLISFAVINGWLIASPTHSLGRALDTVNGKVPAIGSDPAWAKAFSLLPNNASAWFDIDYRQTLKLAKAANQNVSSPVAETASNIVVATAYTENGTQMREDIVSVPTTSAARALFAKEARALPAVSDAILQRAPQSSEAILFTNPGYYWTLLRPMLAAQLRAVTGSRDTSAFAPLDAVAPYFHRDAGLDLTWSASRGFGLVIMAHADTHAAALHAAKVIAATLTSTGAPVVRGGNSWVLQIPSAAVPAAMPVKVQPFMSAKDDWLVIGTHPMWVQADQTPRLSIPAEAAGSQSVGLSDMAWYTAILDFVATADSSDKVQTTVSLLRALHLETSHGAMWSKMSPSGDCIQAAMTMDGWDWRKAAADLAQVASTTDFKALTPPARLNVAPNP